MEETIKKNLFVFTRSLVKDYRWICAPTYFDKNILLAKMEEVFEKLSLKEHGTFTSTWYKAQLEGDSRQVVFRIVVDGRTDTQSRLIRRYEGSSFSDITPQNISVLEECLREMQEKTNNYEYGNFLQTEKSIEDERKEVENCTIEMGDNRIVIKSDILAQFKKTHTYEDLLALLQVEPNNINREER